MPSPDVERLRSIETFPQLLAYLRDELEWPIDKIKIDDAAFFEYEAEELGIDTKNAAKIKEIKQLRPMESKQPWGIFFVMFKPKRLPVVALRRILRSLVIKNRASAASSQQATWQLHDLLFISSYGESEHRDITFAHFSEDPSVSDLPTLRVLGWDDEDTAMHLGHAHHTLKQKLRWPDDPDDLDTWRTSWSSAFVLRNREVITTSRQLAVRLAELARSIRKRVNAVLTVESEKGPLRKLMQAFQQALIHDLENDDFADMYAQTIAYGLLSARVSRPAGLVADDVVQMVPITNPFLRELMETFLTVGGRKDTIDFDELGVSEVVDVLRDAKMEAVLRDFGDKNPQEDPVIHFYELFLKEYDARKRMQRGVFYTPRPVVSFIVRSVDELLRTEFGLEDGLADTTTWGEMAERFPRSPSGRGAGGEGSLGLQIPEGTDPDQAFVQILDPATGTGTFLVEAIDTIYRTMKGKWEREAGGPLLADVQGRWNDYVPKRLLPRLHGYELMMAPYAIAHMKIGIKLYETGYRFASDERTRVYLTNSLEPAQDFSGTLSFAIPALAHEAEAVNAIKRDQRFTVVIGNPPYANYSANLTEEARRIVDPYRSFQGSPIRERNQLQFERNLQDDFVKFLATGEQLLIASTRGVLGHITNATLLASNSLRGMREHLIATFDRILELHLHGGTNEIGDAAQHDENVFEISQAVAVHLYCRASLGGSDTVHYADMYGRRDAKYAQLIELTPRELIWQAISPDSSNCGFMPQDGAYPEIAFPVEDCFSQFGAGIKTNRDAVAIGFNAPELLSAVAGFDQALVQDPSSSQYLLPIQYRPLDYRYIFYHKDVVKSRSLPTMRHMTGGPNLGLVASSTWTTPERFSVGCSRIMIEMKTGTHDRGTTLFPLYRYDSLLGQPATCGHNLRTTFVDAWKMHTGLRFVPDGPGDFSETIGPEDVFHWLYGLFYAPSYRERYRATLAQGYPKVLFPGSKDLLPRIATAGEELTRLHLFETTGVTHYITTPLGLEEAAVEKVSYSDKTVWIDKAKTRGFRGVPEEVWNFHVGGYQVCAKWLKDRQAKGGKNPRPGRVLTDEDIDHYQKIVVALSETIRIMAKIDETIEAHGGWPGAFVTEPVSESSEGEAAEKSDRQPWEMTRGEFNAFRVSQGYENVQENSQLYWQEIKKALAEGKPLQPRVLREYEQLFG